MKIIAKISGLEPWFYSVLRIVAGFLFLWHGSQKLFGFPPAGYHMPPLMIAAGIIEFFGGFLIMIGFLTRWTAFICSGQMAYAYWFVHGLNAALPLVNKGELAVLYCFIFLFIFIKGAGVFSIDNIFFRNK